MTTVLVSLRHAPLPDQSFLDPTRIETEDGTVLTEWTLRGTHAQQVPLSEIPPFLQQATVAVEDARFYQHGAFNLESTARALLVDLRHGRVLQGGSTITQQLAKNLFLQPDRTLGRKLREALLAMQLELHESKSQILSQYLNTVYYGHGAYGVAAAAQMYFHKPVRDLTLAECALLAGLPRGPALYSPIVHPDAAKARQSLVLERMVKVGFLTQAEADAALRQPLHVYPPADPAAAAPYFTATALHEATRTFQLDHDALYRGGLRITTTLDPVLQKAAEHAVATTLPKDSGLQAALVAIDPQTGAIKALVGGRDFATSPYNRALAERQPGSTFKAVLYAAALQHGWAPNRQVASEMTTFLYDQSKLYTVHDYGDLYAHRPLTMREAIARSDNVYAVTANLDIGPNQVMEEAKQLGITTPLAPYPALALGVFPVSPVQMAASYAAFANGGYRVEPYAVEQVRSAADGTVQQHEVHKEHVLDSRTCFQLTDLMTSVVEPGGTGYRVRPYLHGPVAAKTGTTDTDAWMVGYTPQLVCAVWVGYDDNRPLDQMESHLAAPIWGKFMGTAQQRLPGPWFTPPAGLEKRVIDPVTGQLATDTCAVTETDWFLPGTGPTDPCSLHPARTTAPQPQSPIQTAEAWWHRWVHRLSPRH
ncbi:MAG: PBP1A family penicillin-binding protein [Alicyclobacillus sp.]|nr:PBP1A family penicillin-binding protein [Alicyclobacillus sp.]